MDKISLSCKFCDWKIEGTWRQLRHHVKTTHKEEYRQIISRIELETGGKPPVDGDSRERKLNAIPFSSLSFDQRRQIGLDDTEED